MVTVSLSHVLTLRTFRVSPAWLDPATKKMTRSCCLAWPPSYQPVVLIPCVYPLCCPHLMVCPVHPWWQKEHVAGCPQAGTNSRWGAASSAPEWLPQLFWVCCVFESLKDGGCERWSDFHPLSTWEASSDDTQPWPCTCLCCVMIDYGKQGWPQSGEHRGCWSWPSSVTSNLPPPFDKPGEVSLSAGPRTDVLGLPHLQGLWLLARHTPLQGWALQLCGCHKARRIQCCVYVRLPKEWGRLLI